MPKRGERKKPAKAGKRRVLKRQALDTQHLGIVGMYVTPALPGKHDKEALSDRMRFKYASRSVVGKDVGPTTLESMTIKEMATHDNPMHLSALYEFMRMLFLTTPSRAHMDVKLGSCDPNGSLNDNDEQKLQAIFDRHASVHTARTAT